MRRSNELCAPMGSFGLRLSAALLIVTLWILFVAGIRPDEMIVGSGVLLLTAVFLCQVSRAENLRIDLDLRGLAEGWRVPWYVCTGVAEIVTVFVMDLFRVKRAASFYRVSGFKTDKSDPRLVARRVLATFYTTMAPNFIVIGIDYNQSRMLFHQLERSSIPKMTKALGAQPGVRRS